MTSAARTTLVRWSAYFLDRASVSYSIVQQRIKLGELKSGRQVQLEYWKHLFWGKLTYAQRHTIGEQMVPTFSGGGEVLLVRKLPFACDRYVSVGDVVLLKDPEDCNNQLVRRIAATEGYEMASNDENDEPFVLDAKQCWVLSDNRTMEVKEAQDSRTFGPVSADHILGRVIYKLRTAEDHGCIENSQFSMEWDQPLLEVELNVNEMAKKIN